MYKTSKKTRAKLSNLSDHQRIIETLQGVQWNNLFLVYVLM